MLSTFYSLSVEISTLLLLVILILIETFGSNSGSKILSKIALLGIAIIFIISAQLTATSEPILGGAFRLDGLAIFLKGFFLHRESFPEESEKGGSIYQRHWDLRVRCDRHN